MRVRITYGVDVEEVPTKVQELGFNAVENLQETVHSITRVLKDISSCDGDYELVLRMLQKARKELTNADSILVDVLSILEGLDNYNKGAQDVSEGRSTMDPSGDITSETKNPGQG